MMASEISRHTKFYKMKVSYRTKKPRTGLLLRRIREILSREAFLWAPMVFTAQCAN
jgi:hypothetical protein